MKYSVKINGKNYDVEIQKNDCGYIAPVVAAPVVAQPTAAAPIVVPVTAQSNLEVLSPMPGSVFKILVNVGQQVSEGETVVILEAMKMEIDVNAPASGTIKQILINVGTSVAANDVLIVMN